MTRRTYTVSHALDLHPAPNGYDRRGLDWDLYTYGPGHWCVGSGHSGSFPEEAVAHAYGRRWITTGLPAADQRAPGVEQFIEIRRAA